eukprot:GHRR01028888.1.p1 GENE.GHRR01028888.1~~GHRR01028888.1.p1  ORF type:complete len:145 (+),score=25.88 GHRR01028888.1:130-564(+)
MGKSAIFKTLWSFSVTCCQHTPCRQLNSTWNTLCLQQLGNSWLSCGTQQQTHVFTSSADASRLCQMTQRPTQATAEAAMPAHMPLWPAQQWTSQRHYSQEDLRVIHADLSEREYHRLADETLDQLQEHLEVCWRNVGLCALSPA